MFVNIIVEDLDRARVVDSARKVWLKAKSKLQVRAARGMLSVQDLHRYLHTVAMRRRVHRCAHAEAHKVLEAILVPERASNALLCAIGQVIVRFTHSMLMLCYQHWPAYRHAVSRAVARGVVSRPIAFVLAPERPLAPSCRNDPASQRDSCSPVECGEKRRTTTRNLEPGGSRRTGFGVRALRSNRGSLGKNEGRQGDSKQESGERWEMNLVVGDEPAPGRTRNAGAGWEVRRASART
jgi:plasmid stability protein